MAQLLRPCCVSWKVARSIPDGITVIFIDIILLAALMALALTQLLT
jgi:hypothetical protein